MPNAGSLDHVFRRLLLVALVGLALTRSEAALSDDNIEIVPFESLTFPGSLFVPPFLPPVQDGSPATIFGLLRLPEGTGRVPAVVITHACNGLGGAETYWGRHLRELGIATFAVNSFSGRNMTRACSGRDTISMASLLTDVYRARDLLARHPRIEPSQIALMGFSLGGRIALWANQERFQERYASGTTRFVAHLAFYPTSCHIKLADEIRISDVPVRIFHGAADDATVIGRCRDYVERLRHAGKDIALFEYPGASHWFDNPDLASRQTVFGVTNFSNCAFLERDEKIIDATTGELAGTASPCVVMQGSYGYHAEAHKQAAADVEAFLQGLFRLK